MVKQQHKSKERIRDLAEVYTADREINAMLDVVGESSYNIEFRFLEPSCGNGNILAGILVRKLSVVAQKFRKQQDFEFNTLKALAAIYGVDIDLENVKESRARLEAIIRDHYSKQLNTKKPREGFYEAVSYILKHNIVKGDMLNGVDKIHFTEFSSPKIYTFKQRVYRLTDLVNHTGHLWNQRPGWVSETNAKNYWEIHV